MTNRQEEKVQTRGPDGGNPTLKRQGRFPGAPGRHMALAVWPARGRLVEVIGARPSRAKAKRRKASRGDEPAPGGEVRYPLGPRGVLATEWSRSLLALPKAFCRAPRKR